MSRERALFPGFDAIFIEPGPSGLLTRGTSEIFPTGRNFYSLDPFKILAKAAWRIGRVYGYEATTQEVDDWIFDDITRTFVLDDEMRQFFEENNPYALEEIGRRLLEAAERGLWDADPEVLDGLKDAYLEMEGWIEERMGDVQGDFQGGSIDVVTAEEVAGWKEKMGAVLG